MELRQTAMPMTLSVCRPIQRYVKKGCSAPSDCLEPEYWLEDFICSLWIDEFVRWMRVFSRDALSRGWTYLQPPARAC